MATQLIRDLSHLTPDQQRGVVTIGNFDGVHRGHQQLLKKVVRQAKSLGVSSWVITFEPHSAEFFHRTHVTVPRLTRLREKFCALAECGIDYVLVLRFNHALAQLSAADFVHKIIYQGLHPQHIIVGDDFRFGYQRQGDFDYLTAQGQQLGFTVEAMATMTIEGERVSSTRVRQALQSGNHALVKCLLGHPYSMMGRIVHGDKLGRVLGFPTANIFLHRFLTAVHGIYTVWLYGVTPQPWPGVANVGERPTVNGTRSLLEVHLLDFHHDIYGRQVCVEFCEKLRDEVRYPNLELLKAAIAQDVLAARAYFMGESK